MPVVQTPTPTPSMHPLDKNHCRRPARNWSTTAMDVLVESSHLKIRETVRTIHLLFPGVPAQSSLGCHSAMKKFMVSLSSAIWIYYSGATRMPKHQVWMHSWQKGTQEFSTTNINFLLKVLPPFAPYIHQKNSRSSCNLQSWTGWLFWHKQPDERPCSPSLFYSYVHYTCSFLTRSHVKILECVRLLEPFWWLTWFKLLNSSNFQWPAAHVQ